MRQFKDSGIEWIGKIPETWEVCKLNYIYRFQTGATPPSKVENYFDGDIKWANGSHFSPERQSEGMPYITAGDIRGKGIDYNNAMRIRMEDYNTLESQGCRPHKGDVLMVKDGATTGRVGMMTDDEKCVLICERAASYIGATARD